MYRPSLFLDIFHIKNNFAISVNLFLTLFGFIVGYFTDIFTNNAHAFMAVSIVVFVDFFFGVLKGIKTNTFELAKASKVILYFIVYNLVLAMALSIEKGFSYAYWVAEAVMIPILIFQIISALKSLSLAGYLPKGVITNIINNIDSYKNITINNVKNSTKEEIKE